MESSNEQVSKKSQLIGVETMRSVCFKNLHYQGVVWPPPRAWPSNSAQHFGSPCLLGIFYEIMRFENFFLKFWARLEIFCFEFLIFCYGLKFLKLHKGAACAQLLRARVQLVRTRAQLVRARAQLVRSLCAACAQHQLHSGQFLPQMLAYEFRGPPH